MKNDILVSIIIALYNKAQYIERCFNSIISQSYKNIECIIVEDCSTDDSLQLLQKLIQTYSGHIKFLILRHATNSGLSTARNTAIKNANGDYIYYLDADDEITENCISSLVALAKKYSGVDMVQGGTIILKGDVNSNEKQEDLLPEFASGNLQIKKRYSQRIPTAAWNKLFKMEFIIENNLYQKNGLIHESTLFNQKCLKRVLSWIRPFF